MAVLEDLQAEIARLKAENERLAKAKAQGQRVTMKVTEKGGVSVYGLGRFPVTLYRGQWERLGQAMPEVLRFIQANVDRLSVKE